MRGQISGKKILVWLKHWNFLDNFFTDSIKSTKILTCKCFFLFRYLFAKQNKFGQMCKYQELPGSPHHSLKFTTAFSESQYRANVNSNSVHTFILTVTILKKWLPSHELGIIPLSHGCL